MASARPGRNGTLDGIRGLLALVVLAHHAWPVYPWTLAAANVAVCGFFVLSGIVLTRGWDGRYLSFLLRRFLRLWPLYAMCLAVGYALAGQPPIWSQFFWWPMIDPNDPVQINPPAWSLCVEWWAMFLMPLFVRLRRWALFLAAAFIAAGQIDAHLSFGVYFALGAGLAYLDPRVRFLETAIPQYLGRVSYPLYLSHWLVITYAPGPTLLRVALAFAVAHLLLLTVERWSIAVSHAVKRRKAAALV